MLSKVVPNTITTLKTTSQSQNTPTLAVEIQNHSLIQTHSYIILSEDERNITEECEGADI